MTEQPLRRPTVAIIGSHPRSREDFDFSRRDCDVWTFNEAYGSPADKWCSYSTGIMQIHKPVIWRTTQNRNDPKHYEWLQNQDEVTVWMQEKYDDVPMSRRYPLDEIKAAYPRAYFTSSVAYAVALAVYLEYKRIEIYGVEMETQTEYGHQRNGVAYWIGFAEGKGIEVEMNAKGFFDTVLYAYEGEARIPLDFYKERIEHFTNYCDQAQEAYEKSKDAAFALMDTWVNDYKADLSGLEAMLTQMGQFAHNFGAVDGGRQLNEYYLKKCEKMQDEVGTYLIVKQEYESALHSCAKSLQEKMQEASIIGKELVEKHKAFSTLSNKEIRARIVDDFKEVLDKWVRANSEAGVMNGSQIEARQLMGKIDELLEAAGGEENAQLMVEPMQQDIEVLEGDLEKMLSNR